MTKLIINFKLILVIFTACMLCWGNILPSSQHFLTTSNIPTFSSITNFLTTNFQILNYFQISMFLAGGTTCEGLLSCCLVKPSKLFILGSFQLLWVIYTGLLPVVAYCHPKSQQIRVSQLILNLAIRFFLKSVGSPRDLIYSSVSVFSIQTDQFYPIILLSPTVDS